ncbi:MAG: DUF3999 domain-containing protein [Burkholderiales bacterium]|nr:DUF3999 domain-containing protein [Burkholderiales bacterium]
MQVLEPPRLRCAWASICLAASAFATAAADADDAAYRFSAPIEVQRGAPFIRIALPASAYAHTEQADLRDLRVLDAAGERVPFALLAPRAAKSELQEQARDAAIYALPPLPARGQAWPSPLEVTLQGDRISVRPKRGLPSAANAGRAPGWLVDLGEPDKASDRKPDQATPRALQLAWSGPADFSVGVDVELSADLRQWRTGGSSQLLALASPGGALIQARIMLPPAPARFVRLVWHDPEAAPKLTGAKAIFDLRENLSVDPPAQIVALALPTANDDDPAARRALVFDLGGALPMLDIELRMASGTHVAPVRVQGRRRVDQAWTDLAWAVFYRIERDGQVSTAPPLKLRSTQRYLRLVPDERAAALSQAQATLLVNAELASLVYARQGREPFTLQAGSGDAKASALPIATLVPALDEERPRFGQATLGAWSESEAVVRGLQSRARLAAMRPWLLWAVLLAGVAGLGAMVWRLARSSKAPD